MALEDSEIRFNAVYLEKIRFGSQQAVVLHAFNTSALETEAVGSLWGQGEPGLHSEFQDRLQSYPEKPCVKKKKNKSKQ